MTARDARAEAQAVLGTRGTARVLEPSPPASHDAPDFTDDPVDPAGADDVYSPVGTGAHRWIDIDDPAINDFARDRWLGPYKALDALGPNHGTTRDALLRLAVHVIYRARRAANGKYGLRWTLGGFGTPFFGDDEQVRVSGAVLVRQRGDSIATEPITTLQAAARFVGVEFDADFDHGFHDVADAGDPTADLPIDVSAALRIGDWFGFAWSVLEEVRQEQAAHAPSRVQLWPEHFDVAFDVAFDGTSTERRVNLGASPGDGPSSQPYLYVGPWTDDRPGDDDFWDQPFGAILRYDDLRSAGGADEQRAAALDFFRSGVQRLRG